jgi:small subunit ribosomal protein S4e
MSNHQKRLAVPNSWPVERKTETFTVKAEGPHGDDGVPLVVVLRDVLGYVDSSKDADYAVNHGGVLVNGETPSDARRPIGMFDILAFPERAEYYRVFPDEGGRLGLTPIDEDAAGSRLGKIIDKTTVSGGRTQLNLHDGSNLLVEEDEYGAGDSVVVSNDDKEIIAHFEYEEGALVTAVDGQHAGEIGTVSEIDVTPGSADNIVYVETEDGEFETVAEYVVVIDENFTGGDAGTASEESSGESREDGGDE